MVYLTYCEVESLVKGTPVEKVAALIATRKKQRKQAEDYTLPDACVGSVVPAKRAKVVASKSLTGIGVSGGVATGRARIILNAEAAFEREIEHGDILVAPFTDTLWTPLFIPAAAIVVETGGDAWFGGNGHVLCWARLTCHLTYLRFTTRGLARRRRDGVESATDPGPGGGPSAGAG